MIEFYEEQLDQTKNRIIQLEKDICVIQEHVAQLTDHIKEMQKFMVKLAQNQTEITKRVSLWPYIAISERGDYDD